MDWLRIEAGKYRSADGRFSIERDDVGELDSPEDDREVHTEWFLYDEGGNMIDGYPTLRAAKAAA